MTAKSAAADWESGFGSGGGRGTSRGLKGFVMFFVIFGLASIIFLTTALLVAALMLRGQWERMGGPDNRGSTR